MNESVKEKVTVSRAFLLLALSYLRGECNERINSIVLQDFIRYGYSTSLLDLVN